MGNWHPLETMPYYTMDSISPFQMLLSSVIHCLKKIHHYLVIHFEYSLHLWQNKLYKIIKISILIRWGSLKEATYFKCILLTFSLNLWCTTLCDWTELIVWETASRPAYSRPPIAKAITQSPRVAVISKRTPPPSNHTTTFRILGTRDAKNKSAFAFWFLSTPQTILSHGTVRSNANKWVAHSRTHTARSSGATFFTSSPYAKCYRYSLSYMYMSELDKLGR